ncbi:glycoside hydrolase family 20 zincin-like fold domain-containing protein [Paenarthrobacter sp. PH39-S1]|uniref:glycoside hydrolase family 20 zincin-like fold domain-containing protein n=1 Tax=Paenarthrobacter sp. PH39-S1 TaxID=3046204 RepID=UPI0024B915C6|nr:glycoside hydrolase family 20 zincin-like fold domain-containing protein [Paenarthrobacter sp. PH39-S1]MDJ0357953.1 hypothetical protein [Paenarthrobacter sp. PH39-S1]
MTTAELMANTHGANANSCPAVVPALQQWEGGHGFLTLADGFRVVVNDPGLAATAEQLVTDIAEVCGIAGRSGAQPGGAGPAEVQAPEGVAPAGGISLLPGARPVHRPGSA